MRKLIITLWSLALFVTTQAGDYAKYYQQLPTPVKAVVPVQIPDRQLNLVDCGGVGDGVTLCTDAFQKAIAQLAEMGGGRVLVPQGIWLTGPIELLDNIELHLDKNAIIYFSPDKRLYPNTTRRSSRVRPCIGATRRHNIAITGQGIIDGNGQQWRPVKRGKMSDVEWNLYKDMGGQVTDDGSLWYPWQMKNNYPDIADSPKKQEGMRNDLVRIEHCENVLFEGVTFQNSPRFHVHPCYCRNVILDGITVSSPWNVQNADGIDLSDCHQALIVNSTVSVGDDGLCMKSGAPAPNRLAGCQDILIDNCTVYHAHGGFVLGSETVGGVRDMVVRRCRFSGTDTGLRFKSGIGRGGKTERLYVSDIVMTDIKDEAIVFQCDYVNRPAGSDDKQTPTFTEEQRRLAPQFQDIHIANVVCYGVRTGIRASGIAGLDCVHDIDISNCTIIYNKVATQIDEATTQLRLQGVRLVENKKAEQEKSNQ